MPMQNPITVFNPALKLTPLYNSEDARVIPVNLPPLVTYPSGLLLGQVTGSANDVQTVTPPGSGTYTLSGTNPLTQQPFTTAAIAFNANDAAVLAALTAVLGAGLSVASLAVTFGGQFARTPVPLMTASAGSVAHTTTGRTAKTYATYASGNSDGSQIPAVFLEYPCTTDANGWISTSQFVGQSKPFATAFYSGTFDCADLTGLDANAVTKLAGRLVSGTVTSGTFTF